jgi:hypothetical protein
MQCWLAFGCAALSVLAPVGGHADDYVPAQALADAPAWVRPLQCRDVASPSGGNLADARFRQWFDGIMKSVEDLGISGDELYRQFLSTCGQQQSWSVIAIVLGEREMMSGLSPQHASGK